MKITLIHGTMRRGGTYTLAREALKSFPDAEVKEFFLPQALPHFCTGCYACFTKGEEYCPHKEYTIPLWEALQEAELLIFSSPVYALHVPGQVKSFLDHFAWAWMSHRPQPEMFSKAALVVVTASAVAMRNALKDITGALRYWGVGHIETFGEALYASRWQDISEEKQQKLLAKVSQKANKIKSRLARGIKPSLSFKFFFKGGALMQSKYPFYAFDASYWQARGWLDGKRPWRAPKI